MSNVVELGAFRISRKRRSFYSAEGECLHRQLVLEEHGQIVRCQDCRVQVDAFWALQYLAEEWERMESKLEARKQEVHEARQHSFHLIAAKKVEQAWRSRSMVPACPHCGGGILPEDGLGMTQVNRKLELRRRDVEQQKRKEEREPAEKVETTGP